MTGLIAFVFVGLFSPGPNVVMLAHSGAYFGFRRTLPHLAGVVVGVGIIGLATGLGLAGLITAYPPLETALKIAASLWILWLAYRLWSSSAANQTTQSRPFRFLEAVLFQWVNPKIWAVALAAISGHAVGAGVTEQSLRLGLTMSSVNLFVCLFWSGAGTLLALLLQTPRAWRLFARGMAVALAAAALMVFF